MAIHYNCRHCGVTIGKLDLEHVSSSQLGFDHLDDNERQEMVQYDQLGDIHVKSICEDCQEALNRNPDLHQLDTFIQ